MKGLITMGSNPSMRWLQLSLWVFASLMLVNTVFAQGIVSFISRTDFQVGVFPDSVIAGDFNGDGFLDLITANVSDNSVSILLGQGDGTFGMAQNFSVGNRPRSVVESDFNV